MIRNFFKRSVFIIVMFCISGFIFLGYRGIIGNIKSRLLELSEKTFSADISIDQARLRFPGCLELKDIKIDDIVSISSIRIYPSPSSFFIKNKLIILKISVTDPLVSIKKEDAERWKRSEFLSVNKGQMEQKPLLSDFLFSKIYIYNGVVSYDKGGNDEFEFIDINGEIDAPGLYSLKGRAFDFVISGFLKNKETDFLSPLKLSGRAGPDSIIRANLQIDDIKIKTLGMVYDKYLSRVIKEAQLDLNSTIELSKSSFLARCLLESKDVVLKNDIIKKAASPFLARFVLLFNFKDKLVKLKNIQGNFFKLILSRS